jgi:PAS domain S-box-containing protein
MSPDSIEPVHAADTVLDRSAEREAFLFRVGDAIRPLRDPATILAETCQLFGVYLRANRVMYVEIDGDVCTVLEKYVNGMPSMMGHVRWTNFAGMFINEFGRDSVLVVHDTETDPRIAGAREDLRAAGIGAYLIPLLMKDGRAVAAFGIHSRTPRVWTSDEITLVRRVTDRIWAALEQRQLEAALCAREERLAFLLRLNDALRPLSDPADVQDTAARLLGEHLRVGRVGYADVGDGEYIIRREYALGVAPLIGQGPVETFGAALRETYRRGEPVVVSDVQTDVRLTEAEKARLLTQQIAAFVNVTLVKDAKVVAAFGANQSAPRAWTPPEVELIRDVAERTWDAVERSRAEMALRTSEQKLRLSLQAALLGTWRYDLNTRAFDADEIFKMLHGVEKDAVIRTLEDTCRRVHPDDLPRALARFERAAAEGGTYESEYRVGLEDGAMRWIAVLGTVQAETASFIGVVQDITFRKRSELALLRGENEAFQAAMCGEPPHTSLAALLRAVALRFGGDARAAFYVPDEDVVTLRHVVGMSDDYARDVDRFPIGADSLACGLAVQRGEPVITPDVTREPRWRAWLWLAEKHGFRACWSFPVRTTGGPILGSLVLYFERPREVTPEEHEWIRGITGAATIILSRDKEALQLRDRTIQLRRLASELTIVEQRTRERLAQTLHDGLQQQLAVVALHLEQLVSRGPWEKLLAAQLARVQGELTEAITAARSLSVELYPPVLQSAGLPAAFGWLRVWSQRAYGLDVSVSVDPFADSPRRDLRTLLFESVRELLFNVVKHARVSEVTIDLTRDAAGRLCITVADQGIGFDPVELTKRATTGLTGWGLFSIRERLTLIGGQFEIQSAPGRGSRFRLTAPSGTEPGEVVAAPPLTDAFKPPVSPDAPVGVALERPIRILLVDDHAAVREALRGLLQQRLEFQVVGEAANGLEAIARTRLLRPDVILMDVSMPEMGGVEATALIHAEFPATQIFGLSTEERIAELHAIERAGGAGYFFKGTDTNFMLNRLSTCAFVRSEPS